MEKKYTITLRLSYDQFAWLGALCRRSKQTQSAVIRSLIESGTVRERITKEHIHIKRISSFVTISRDENLCSLNFSIHPYQISSI